MKFFRALHARALASAAREAAPVELSELEALGILARAFFARVRGELWRRRFGASSGALYVGRGVRITSAARIRAGRGVKIEEGVELQGLARCGITLGDGVTLGRQASIRPSSYYGTDLGEGLSIGPGSAIGAFCWFGASGFVEIGRNVLFGPRVVIIPENHAHADPRLTIKEQGVVRADVVIEDDCWIGCNVTILAGVRIGRGSIVAAGAVVNRDVAPRSIVGGVPARLLRMRADSDAAEPPKPDLATPDPASIRSSARARLEETAR